jgi:hypothetical protein
VEDVVLRSRANVRREGLSRQVGQQDRLIG